MDEEYKVKAKEGEKVKGRRLPWKKAVRKEAGKGAVEEGEGIVPEGVFTENSDRKVVARGRSKGRGLGKVSFFLCVLCCAVLCCVVLFCCKINREG